MELELLIKNRSGKVKFIAGLIILAVLCILTSSFSIFYYILGLLTPSLLQQMFFILNESRTIREFLFKSTMRGRGRGGTRQWRGRRGQRQGRAGFGPRQRNEGGQNYLEDQFDPAQGHGVLLGDALQLFSMPGMWSLENCYHGEWLSGHYGGPHPGLYRVRYYPLRHEENLSGRTVNDLPLHEDVE